MITLERAKELLNDPVLSDEQVRQIRDDFQILADIIFEQWQKEKKYEQISKISSKNIK